jgi:CDP-4-dehydro-6-deoxyglucose reductase
LVYRFDFERKKPVVVDPLNCMVGCTTCANTCPAHALVFPPIESVLALEGRALVRHAVEDDLQTRHDILASGMSVPHPDRIITLAVQSIDKPGGDVLRVVLAPVTTGECFCEFAPGQYIELWQPESSHLSRSYSIANAPHGDGSITLHIRRVDGGRFTQWAFDAMKLGDTLKARGPLGSFTMRSPADVPLLFIAGGTGLAPVLALLEQQVQFAANRDMVLLWGVRQVADLYALDALQALSVRAPGLRITLAVEKLPSPAAVSQAIHFVEGSVLDAMANDAVLPGQRDIYAAGPPVMLREVAHALDRAGVARSRVYMDSFGV